MGNKILVEFSPNTLAIFLKAVNIASQRINDAIIVLMSVVDFN